MPIISLSTPASIFLLNASVQIDHIRLENATINSECIGMTGQVRVGTKANQIGNFIMIRKWQLEGSKDKTLHITVTLCS